MNEGRRGGLPRASRAAWVAGALFGATGVALAALAAHGMALLGDERHVALLRTGVEMQMWQAAALGGAGALARHERTLAPLGIGLVIAGTLAFAVGVDGLAFRLPSTGPLAPTGGTAVIAGWLVLAAAAFRAR